MRHPVGGGLRPGQGPGHGLRDHYRPRHDPGAQILAHLSDTFISEELTVAFRGEPQAVHVLCLGITESDHEWLQAHNDDVEACAGYLGANTITAALAHPFYAVGAPLTARHRRRLAQLFRSGRPATGRVPKS